MEFGFYSSQVERGTCYWQTDTAGRVYRARREVVEQDMHVVDAISQS